MKLNLSDPKTLAEKIEWLKFNDHNELSIQLCDKLSVRDYVVEKTGNAMLLNRLIVGPCDSANEIPLADLPERYVIKMNHWSGDALINDGTKPIQQEYLNEIDTRLKLRLGGFKKAEWPYWHITPQVFVEEYLEDKFGQLVDYKIFCFNGEPKLIMVCKDRQIKVKKFFFDTDWTPIPITDPKHPKIDEGSNFPKPESLDEMLRHAASLSEDFVLVRADFYDVFGECRFGELVLYPECGIYCHFKPEEWNKVIGSWLILPEANRNPRFAFGAGW